MALNIAGLVVVIIGSLFLFLAIFELKSNPLYRLLVHRASWCVGCGDDDQEKKEARARVWIATYSTLMIIFGALVMEGVFVERKIGSSD